MDDAFLVVFLRALRGEDLHQIEAKGKTKAPPIERSALAVDDRGSCP
jgi:hypothetical protein